MVNPCFQGPEILRRLPAMLETLPVAGSGSDPFNSNRMQQVAVAAIFDAVDYDVLMLPAIRPAALSNMTWKIKMVASAQNIALPLAGRDEARPVADRPPLRRHIPALDGVRGLAILMVLLFHFVANTTPTNGFERVLGAITNYGSYGVELFFVLSGFLITGILYDDRGSPDYFRNFFMRRVLRIFPLYFGALVAVFLIAPRIPALRGEVLTNMVEHQAWAWLYAVNLYIAREGDWAFAYLDHFWSLAVEEHFYLFWPLVVSLLVWRPRLLIAASLAIAIAAMTARIAAASAGVNWWTTYVLTPFRLDGLALGAVLAVAIRQPGGLDRALHLLPRVSAAAALVLALTFAWSRFVPDFNQGLVLGTRAAVFQVLLGCFLLWVLVAPSGSVTAWLMRSRPLVFLGTYSYGLYVYHHFISYYLASHRTEFAIAEKIGSHTLAVALQASAGIVVSIGLAWLSYEYFEKRILGWKRYFMPAVPSASRR